ncbi:MAG: enoyl-CoA hydratase/isomerase family protein [Rhodobiaceae bacterium]|nr:enoyl-CoA hydratase/isomerase family protein [Rhodobiaceae bacterium]MCC0056037.1 enoyl-CoA hydratase/isomerase family protein [Rhodobiaceae bacterium]
MTETTREDPILFEKRGHVAILTLNRPRVMNAVNRALWFGAGEAIDEFAADPAMKVLIITGAGERAFCAGSDLKAKAAGEMEFTAEEWARWGYAGIIRHFVPKPVIAAVNGLALGGGTEIALSCDLIVAAEHASIGLPEPLHGQIAGAGGLLRLPRQIPLKVAMNTILTGEFMSAEEAKGWGLVNDVVPAGELIDKALEKAEKICAASPAAIRASKETVYRGLEVPLDFPGEAWKINQSFIDIVEAGPDSKEGAKAFAEKRHPVWKS